MAGLSIDLGHNYNDINSEQFWTAVALFTGRVELLGVGQLPGLMFRGIFETMRFSIGVCLCSISCPITSQTKVSLRALLLSV